MLYAVEGSPWHVDRDGDPFVPFLDKEGFAALQHVGLLVLRQITTLKAPMSAFWSQYQRSVGEGAKSVIPRRSARYREP